MVQHMVYIFYPLGDPCSPYSSSIYKVSRLDKPRSKIFWLLRYSEFSVLSEKDYSVSISSDSIQMSSLPYHCALYNSLAKNKDQASSERSCFGGRSLL